MELLEVNTLRSFSLHAFLTCQVLLCSWFGWTRVGVLHLCRHKNLMTELFDFHLVVFHSFNSTPGRRSRAKPDKASPG